MRSSLFTLLCCLALGREVAAAQRTDHFVESRPGIRIYIRKVVDRDNRRGLPVLLVHGGGPPGEVVFDLGVPGYSLAEDLARAGHLVYMVDVRGWGRSTWPAVMDSTNPHAPQAVTSSEALEDIGAAVNWIQADSRQKAVALLGHATGGHWAGMYTAGHNGNVSRLIMLNSMYGVSAPWALSSGFQNPQDATEFDPSAGAYRLADGNSLVAGWNRAIPTDDKTTWRDPRVVEAYVRDGLASDPTSLSRTPPAMRIPGAFRREHFEMARGKKFWDAHDIRVPTLYVRGTRDHWSRPEDLEALKHDLTNAKAAFQSIPDGTHFLFLDRPERGRSAFLQLILDFLK